MPGESFAAGAQAVGAAGPGVFDHGAEGVVVMESLEDAIPESDERSEGPQVEQLVEGSQPRGQDGGRQKLAKLREELGSGEAGAQQWGGDFGFGAGLGLGGRFGFGGVFGFWIWHVCMCYDIHTV